MIWYQNRILIRKITYLKKSTYIMNENHAIYNKVLFIHIIELQRYDVVWVHGVK